MNNSQSEDSPNLKEKIPRKIIVKASIWEERGPSGMIYEDAIKGTIFIT
jgi:hypothetical protein